MMRVISGRYGGRRLHAVRSPGLRPTGDRVREALFAILGDAVVGSSVADLYAGTGALAIEAISRGAERATCVERSRRAVRAIERNLAGLGLEGRIEVVRGDALAFARKAASGGRVFDVVLCDPPYAAPLDPLVESLAGDWWTTVAVVEHAVGREIAPPPGVEADERRYGDTGLTVLWRR